ncbi:MAG: adenylosuccinate synthase [Culicoidibacterales bacterium]
MSTVAVVGTQWGDEGKGKITDYLAQEADVVVRYQGGDNAGHTVEFNGQQFKIRLVPSGIFNAKMVIMGNGMVINPKTLLGEMTMLTERGIDVSKLLISDRAHLIMPYHPEIDEIQEDKKGELKVGTTKRGIGPAYMDKFARIGIRVGELKDPELFALKLRINLEDKNEYLRANGKEAFDFDAIYAEYMAYAETLRPHIIDASYILNKEIDNGSKVLFEGAQGVMLDIDHGTYPYVTSSNPSAASIPVGAGIPPQSIHEVLGIVKAYSTRVGDGPFPTEFDDEVAHGIRERGREYGTVTKRPRRIGWFDATIIQHTRRVSGLTGLSIMLLDVLTGVEELKICTGYRLNGEVIEYVPSLINEFATCEPIYETLPGWSEDITKVTSFDSLPANAQAYLKRIEALAGVPVVMFSVGPDREQTIRLKPIFK